MKVRKQRVNRATVEQQTQRAKRYSREYTEMIERFKSDPEKKTRVYEKHECKYCFYINYSRIGGASMTESECGICDTVKIFSSTCVDAICGKCSNENGLCQRCGGDIEMKSRNKPYPFQLNELNKG